MDCSYYNYSKIYTKDIIIVSHTVKIVIKIKYKHVEDDK